MEPLSPPLPHDIDELLVDFVQHRLRVALLLLVDRRERIEEGLVLARGEGAPLHAEFLHGAGEAPAVHDHADRPDDARLVHIDLVGGGRDVVAARGADVLDDGVHGNVGIKSPQPADFVVDDARLHRAAARRIDAQDHALGILVFESVLEGFGDAVGARVALGVDDADHIDQRGMFARSEAVVSAPVEREQHQQREIGKTEQLEENTPAAGAALLLESGGRQRLDHVPFPVTFGHVGCPS